MADIKISELEPTTDLEGLYTIGSDKNNLSKKVSLQFLKDAANYANEQGDYAKQAGDTVNGNVGVSDYPEFSASQSYVIGDIVRYNGVLYAFTANHAASAWNGSDVKATSINAITSGKLTELESEIISSTINKQFEQVASDSSGAFKTSSIIIPNGINYCIQTSPKSYEIYIIWSDDSFTRVYDGTWYVMEYPSGKTFKNIRFFATNGVEITAINVTTKPSQLNDEIENIATKIANEIVDGGLERFEANIKLFSENGVYNSSGAFDTKSTKIDNGEIYRIKTTPASSEMYVTWSDNSFTRVYNNSLYKMEYPNGKTFGSIRALGSVGNSINIDIEIAPKSFVSTVGYISQEKVDTEIERVEKLYSPNLSLQTESVITSGLYNTAETSAVKISNGLFYNVKTNQNNPETYVIWDDNSFTRIYTDTWVEMKYPSGKAFKGIRVIGKENGINIDFEVITKSKLWEEIVHPNQTPIRALILGDSYSENGGAWINPMIQMLPNGSSYISLAVGSATIRDRYSDRVAYPYTSRPKNTDNVGNHNTLACQIEKLKRLMKGADLDSGESAIYQNESEYPNVIIIEGGMNDNADTDAKVSTYHAQIDKIVDNVYRKATSSDSKVTVGSVTIKTPIDDVDRTCFAGAYRYLAEELLTLFPNAQIYITTCSPLDYKSGRASSETAMKKAEQQRLCSDIFAFNLIDWHRDGQINTIVNYAKGSGTEDDPYIYADLSGTYVDTNDQLHPNARGGKKYGRLAALRIMQTFLNIGK